MTKKKRNLSGKEERGLAALHHLLVDEECEGKGVFLKHALVGHAKAIKRIAWSPDGKFIATPSHDGTVKIWKFPEATLHTTLKGHQRLVRAAAFTPDSRSLVSVSEDRTLIVWDLAAGGRITSRQPIKKGFPRAVTVADVNGRTLVVSVHDDSFQVRTLESGIPIVRVSGSQVFDIALIHWRGQLCTVYDGAILELTTGRPLGQLQDNVLADRAVAAITGKPLLATVSRTHWDLIKIVDLEAGKTLTVLEGHTDRVTCLSFSCDGRLLASKSYDNSVRLWRTDTWALVTVMSESARSKSASSLAFHPRVPSILASTGELDQVLHIWQLDLNFLLGQTKSLKYTTAKMVLVGDSGVGKTALGLRLFKNTFEKTSSTHGQQFWVVEGLGTTRADGTLCESVLWDLAGQPIYRSIHAIFLENIALALVVFDPTKRQEPLKGVHYWLKQLAGKQTMPPAILVGARIDRGSSAITDQELQQFCACYEISGGYLGTSAMDGQGLAELMDRIKAQVPWKDLPATVTTVTFKRIKDYILWLKESSAPQPAVLGMAELRQHLQGTDAVWTFSEAELLTVLRHLENHGYVIVLNSSASEDVVLLAPELLADLASSIVLKANEQAEGLGSVNENSLLQGEYDFPELADLSRRERDILLDATCVRLLEHNICFREALRDEILLIFPALIKQKRPVFEEFETVDDVSYVVRGSVENVYAALAVLLGYTNTFTRVDQWKNQARYELGEGEICGFRQIEEQEGEIELILYYVKTTPEYARLLFQGLFEKILYQRDVEVTRYPPVFCSNGHLQRRETVMECLRDNRRELFCYLCGSKTALPAIEPMSLADRSFPENPEEALARLRSEYEKHLSRVKGVRRDRAAPQCYLSVLSGEKQKAVQLVKDLRAAGVHIIKDLTQIAPQDSILLIETPRYRQAFLESLPSIAEDVRIIKDHQGRQSGEQQPSILPLLFEGVAGETLGLGVRSADFRQAGRYLISLFDLVLTLYAIPFNHPIFKPLRAALFELWQNKVATFEPTGGSGWQGASTGDSACRGEKRFKIALSYPGEHRDFVEKVADLLAAERGRERIFYDRYYQAELYGLNLDTNLQTIYHDEAELVVVFFCKEYETKEWCGLEWRAIRDLIKHRQDKAVLPVALDKASISGLFSVDNPINAWEYSPEELARLILERLQSME